MTRKVRTNFHNPRGGNLEHFINVLFVGLEVDWLIKVPPQNVVAPPTAQFYNNAKISKQWMEIMKR